jgi:7,8-dihydroneopterin aldolase/epimerase/oxygenase
MAGESLRSSASDTDEIFLEGMRFYAYHGVNSEERALGQHFLVEVVLTVDVRRAGQSDDLADTVSYSAVYKLVCGVAEGESRNLIEAVAEDIAAAILTGFPPVARVTVAVLRALRVASSRSISPNSPSPSPVEIGRRASGVVGVAGNWSNSISPSSQARAKRASTRSRLPSEPVPTAPASSTTPPTVKVIGSVAVACRRRVSSAAARQLRTMTPAAHHIWVMAKLGRDAARPGRANGSRTNRTERAATTASHPSSGRLSTVGSAWRSVSEATRLPVATTRIVNGPTL